MLLLCLLVPFTLFSLISKFVFSYFQCCCSVLFPITLLSPCIPICSSSFPFNCLSLYIPCWYAVFLFPFSHLFLIIPADALSSWPPLLFFLFVLHAALSIYSSLFIFHGTALSSCSPLLFFILLSPAAQHCFPLLSFLFVFHAAALSSCSPLLCFLLFPMLFSFISKAVSINSNAVFSYLQSCCLLTPMLLLYLVSNFSCFSLYSMLHCLVSLFSLSLHIPCFSSFFCSLYSSISHTLCCCSVLFPITLLSLCIRCFAALFHFTCPSLHIPCCCSVLFPITLLSLCIRCCAALFHFTCPSLHIPCCCSVLFPITFLSLCIRCCSALFHFS